MALAACRQQIQQGPLVQATATATPLSTPLPPVATVIPPGTEDNPIHMVINPASSVTDTQVSTFVDALEEQSGLVVDVQVVERYAEALAALCDSIPTNVAVAWLDGVAYQAAMAQNCGEPVMQVRRGRTDARTGDAGEIVVKRGGVSSIQALRGRTFCRLSVNDYYSWLIPSLMMRAGGVDPVNDPEDVVDYSSRNELVGALIDGDCDATGMSDADFDRLRDTQKEELNTLDTSPLLPYAILMYPVSLPLGERIRLDNALLGLDVGPDGSAAMRPLLGQDSLVRVDKNTFSDLSDFLASTRLDFAQLGS